MPLDARQITTAIVQGDAAALALLYQQCFDRLYSIVQRATGRDEAFCLDVVQSAFLRVIRSMKPIDTEAELDAWLRRVALTAAYDALRTERSSQRRDRAAARAEALTTELAGHATAEAERLNALREELARLDGPALHLLEARHRLGWTLERLGRTLGIGPGAADGRLSRAHARLSARLSEFGHE